MDAEALCVCGDLYRRHRATLSRGAVRLLCTKCDDCGGFEAMPGMPTVPAGSVGAAVDEVVAAVDRSERRLILSWDTRWCPTCSSRYLSEDAVCCGAACVAVRIEMYERPQSRESP